MPILDFNKPNKVMSDVEYKSISADGAPPGVYTSNMSESDKLKWKAKIFNNLKNNARIEISKSFHWNNGKSYHEGGKNHFAQVKIVVNKSEDEPFILLSTNGKIAMTLKDFNNLIGSNRRIKTTFKSLKI